MDENTTVVSSTDLEAAVTAGILDARQAEALQAFLRNRLARSPQVTLQGSPAKLRFDLTHLFWYAGALIVIGAMGLFSTLAFEQMGGKALTITAVVYAVFFIWLGDRLWHRPGLRTPGGLCIAVAVSMTPLAIYGVQAEFGLWPTPFDDPAVYSSFSQWINSSWIYMTLGTILAGFLALRFYPFAFIIAVVTAALWCLFMDISPWMFHLGYLSWDLRCQISAGFGLALLIAAWGVDLKAWPAGDIGFWLHLSGLAAFWGGLTLLDSDNDVSRALYCLLNVVLLLLSVFLMRRAYAVFGALGITGYLAMLADDTFRDSLLFPFTLSLIGIGLIALGILYLRKRQALETWLRATLPPGLQHLRPLHARSLAK
ncbi:MAG TPA: hypothetical protein VM659_06310 [Dongiaceae bacterium]|nr:hypothetical protein [Dongiaceae bacterium]